MKRTFNSLMAALSLTLILPAPAFSAGGTIELDTTVDEGEIKYEPYLQGFEGGVMPEGFSNGADSARPWQVDSTQSKSGAMSLRSGVINHNQTSTVVLDTDLPGGTLTFDYLELTESCCDVMELRINGKRYNFRKVAESDQWQHIEVLIPKPTLLVEFTYRKDHIQSAREDAVWIDNIEFTDKISPTANVDDADGDGFSTEIEEQYDAMNPYDADDGAEDYDSDGVTNRAEINSGYSPDVANIFTRKNVFEFYPLGDISRDYQIENSGMITLDSQSLPREGLFQVDRIGNSDLVERREDGIYVLERSIDQPDGSQKQVAFHEGLLQFPHQIRLGETVVDGADYTVTRDGEIIEKAKIDVAVTLLEEYRLLSSSSSADALLFRTTQRITLESGHVEYYTSYEMLGIDVGTLAFFGDKTVDLVDIRVANVDNSIAGQSSEPTSDEAVSRTSGIQAGGGGGGSSSLLFMSLLAGLLIWRRRAQAA